MAVVMRERPDLFANGAVAHVLPIHIKEHVTSLHLQSMENLRCDSLFTGGTLMCSDIKLDYLKWAGVLTSDNVFTWNKSYVERCCDELKTFFDYISVTLTDSQWNVIRECLQGRQDQFYKVYKIKKKSGGYRTIEAPCDDLKYIQRLLLDRFAERLFLANRKAFGFVKKKNTYNAALDIAFNNIYNGLHKSNKALVKIDLKDFFPSITEQMLVHKIFGYFTNRIRYTNKGNWCFWDDLIEASGLVAERKRKPWSVRLKRFVKKNVFVRGAYTCDPGRSTVDINAKAQYRMSHLLMALIDISTFEGRLPQGSPLSPFLSNIVMCDFDAYAFNAFKTRYIRYADDICIITRTVEEAVKFRDIAINGLYKTCPGVSINPKKVNIIKHGKPMRVVGFNVNEDTRWPTLPRYKRKNFEAMLYNLSNGKHKLTPATWSKVNGYYAYFKTSNAVTPKLQALYDNVKRKASK